MLSMLSMLSMLCLAAACGEADSSVPLDPTLNQDLGSQVDVGTEDAGVLDSGGAEDTGGDAATQCVADLPQGSGVGQVAPDVTLTDCAGNAHNLRDLCGAPVWMFLYADWCPTCRSKAPGVSVRQANFGAQGLQSWFVVTANRQGGVPSATECGAIQRTYSLTGPVLIDNGALQDALGVASNDVNVVLDERQVIQSKARYASTNSVDAAIEQVLP